MIEIQLTRGFTAVIDDIDFERVSAHRWHTTGPYTGGIYYAATNVRTSERRPNGKWKYRVVKLHRFLMDLPSDVHVDHKDGNGLNCTRLNMRAATSLQNARNKRKNVRIRTTSRFKGVAWQKSRGRWIAYIKIEDRQLNLGRFTDEVAAARAYNDAARIHYGEFANLNSV